MQYVRAAIEAHRALKHKIHSTRIPLSKNGARAATAFYMSLPLVGGYFVMEYAMEKSNAKWQAVTNADGTISYKVPEQVAERGGVRTERIETSRANFEQVKQRVGEHPGQAPRPT